MSLNKNLGLTIDEDYWHKGRIVMLTGAGRSGTSILGKILGSMQHTYYLYEPAIMKLMPVLCAASDQGARCASAFRSILFEDYFSQLVHGRNLNWNAAEDSYVGHYMPKQEVEARWSEMTRRGEIVDYIKQTKPLFVVKTPEFQSLYAEFDRSFEHNVIIHIIRNGNDVVNSSVNRGWYTDEYMRQSIVDWVEHNDNAEKCPVPWYIDEESKRYFSQWDQVTRAACVWRCLTEQGMARTAAKPATSKEVRYESLCQSPEAIVGFLEQFFNVSRSSITARHMRDIGAFKPKSYASVYPQLQEPEKSKYARLMSQLGYLLDELHV